MNNLFALFLSHPHKKSVVKWVVRYPSLLLSFINPEFYNEYSFSKIIPFVSGMNIEPAKHFFLPEKFARFLKEEKVSLTDANWRLMLYHIIRHIKPQIVVETGVASGLSTAFILCAMDENKSGHLYSIDLPPEECGTKTEENGHIILTDGSNYGSLETGKYVPEYLKYRWTLVYGDSKIVLGQLLEKLGTFDIFFHDSLHTYDHMWYEYEMSWSKIGAGGLLISHDVIWNDAFYDFAKMHKCRPYVYYSLGLIKKRAETIR